MLSNEVSSTIYWVFGMNRPGIEPWSPGVMANTHSSIWTIDGALTSTNTSDKCGPRNIDKDYSSFNKDTGLEPDY